MEQIMTKRPIENGILNAKFSNHFRMKENIISDLILIALGKTHNEVKILNLRVNTI